LTVDPQQVQALTGATSGYVSVYNGRRWVVVNAPVHLDTRAHWPARIARSGHEPPTAAAPLSLEFDLGTNRALRSHKTLVVHTAEPMVGRAAFQAAAGFSATVFPVTPLALSIRTGLDVPNPPLVLQPPMNSPLVPNLPLNPAATYSIIQPHARNVQAANMQCATAAVANGLFFLDDAFDLGVTHSAGRGVAPGGDSLLSWLDDFGQRASEGQCEGDGMHPCRTDAGLAGATARGYVAALYRYIDGFLDPAQLTLAHQGGPDAAYPAACEQLGVDGPVSPRVAEKPTFEWMCERIEAGDAVLVGTMEYTVPEGADPVSGQIPLSAHMLRAYGCGETAGQKYLYLLDDGGQDAPADDFNQACMLNDGLRWWIRGVNDTDGDGWLNIKDNLHEIEIALAIGVK
jgi:hypothetical protein